MLGGGRNGFAKLVTWVSFVGLSLGVMVLTVVVTVMNGFDAELKSRLLQSIPHVTVDQPQAAAQIRTELEGDGAVLAVHNYFQGVGALTAAGEVQPISVYATDAQARESLGYIAQAMTHGTLEDLFADPSGLIIGAPLARYLGVFVGDQVMLMVVASHGESVRPRMVNTTITGLFELGAEPDYNLAIGHLDRFDASVWQTMGELGTQIQLKDPLAAEAFAAQFGAGNDQYNVQSWRASYGELFDAVALEKSMMFVLLLLVVAIAAFNIIAGQTMMVNDKRSNIAILRTMGATQSLMSRVFLLQGLFISLAGTLLGLALGVLVALNINAILDAVAALTGMHLLDGSFFVTVPILILPADLLTIGLISGVLCLLSAWVPARRAGALDPVENLHR